MSSPSARERYSAYRHLAYDVTLQVWPDPALRLTEINGDALAAWERWPEDATRKPPCGGWNWRDSKEHFAHRYHDRFEVALWHGNRLCGLSIGKPSNQKILLRVELLEATTVDKHPLERRVAEILTDCAEAYAAIIRATEVHLMEPANGKLIQYYERLGYRYREGTKYALPSCYRTVEVVDDEGEGEEPNLAVAPQAVRE